MAGIGFELKKLFRRKGFFAGAYAYGYASVICCGPMILGIILLIGISFLAKISGASMHERELLNGMITTTLLMGLTVSSFLSLLVTRYIADMLYEQKQERVMPSFWGATAILLTVGCILYGIFLCFAGIPLLYAMACFLLFGEIVIVWTEISYLTAVKDYQGIFRAFFLALAIGFLCGALFVFVLHLPVVPSLMAAMLVSYGIMCVCYCVLLQRFFPSGKGSCFAFLHWVDEYPTLTWNGLFTNVGLFAHLVMMWASRYGIQIQGLFYHSPDYDIAAIFAFLSVLITTVNYVVSVEVHFYPKYRDYYALFNDKGTIADIDIAGRDMCDTLSRELLYAATRQLFCTIFFLVFGSVLLKKIPLGFTDEALGVFRVLCIGYGLYAIANMLMLSLLYFCDNKGAFFASATFAFGTVLGTLLSFALPAYLRGIGFGIGALAYLIVAWLRLEYYTQSLPYHLLSRQPIIAQKKHGLWTKISHAAERAYEKRSPL
ncbi:MAG: exopolysaccharide Pel transporter PelG [Ruthenibacterium sp.]